LLVELGVRRDKEIIMKKKHVWLSIEAAHFEILLVCVCVSACKSKYWCTII
jgi:hypothetical protein